MSSALQSTLTSLQQNDYVSLIMFTAMGYDYSRIHLGQLTPVVSEGKHLITSQTQPWTWVSTLFIIIRYSGLFALILFISEPLASCDRPPVGSSFLAGSAKTCEILAITSAWTLLLYVCGADLLMILRVWAMYNGSRLILRMLLTLFVLEFIFTFVATAVLSNARTQTAMCILVIIQFVNQSLQMYRVTKQWHINRYMNLLATQGLIYFFANFLFDIINVLANFRLLPSGGWQFLLLLLVQYVPMFVLTPRFVLSIRELYARDVRRRGFGIDTGFGLESSDGRSGAIMTELVFADFEQNDGLVVVGGISTEVINTGP
ncbi:hypothetical protein V8E55_008557 [Tylopilus felleus]